MAAVSLGGLSAPLWGVLTDRYRLHRWVLVIGLFLTAFGLIAFAFSGQPAIWFAMALILSVGAAGASTVANLFVVEMHPKPEWDERIGWLQTFYGLGQVIGLLLAGFLSNLNLNVGLLTSAALSAAAVLLGWLTTKTPPKPSDGKPVLLHTARHAEWTVHSPQRFFHHLSLNGIKQFGLVLRSRFGLFLAIWLLTFAGSAAVFSQYPLLMHYARYFIGCLWHHGWPGPDTLHARRELVRAFRIGTHPACFTGHAPGSFCRSVRAGFYAFRISGLAGNGGLCLCGLRLVADERQRDCPCGGSLPGGRRRGHGHIQCRQCAGGCGRRSFGRLGGGKLGVWSHVCCRGSRRVVRFDAELFV